MTSYIIYSILTLAIIGLAFYIKKVKYRHTQINNLINSVTQAVNSIRYGNLATKLKVEDSEYKSLTDSINRMIETLNDREQMIIEYQSELIRQNELLESVINSLSDGIILLDENGKILRVTPKVTDWFSESYKDIISRNLSDFAEITDIKELNNTEILIKNSANKKFTATTKILTNNKYIVIIKDITSEKEIETLKEDFVATLTHDLKVPIIAEANIIEFLLEEKFGQISDKQKNALLNMQSSNKELIELVQILLETYKIKESGIKLYKENIELSDFIRKIISEMQHIADKSSITLNFNCQSPININADEIQLTRVIKNIISNAISHSNTTDKIDIELTCENNFAQISITDYGQGIPQNEINDIFNKYYSSAKKFRKIGTGLGLYLAKQIVLSHGGNITVESEENTQTRFNIKLPL